MIFSKKTILALVALTALQTPVPIEAAPLGKNGIKDCVLDKLSELLDRKNRSAWRSAAAMLAVILGAFPVSAHAQHVPLWLIAWVLSPILVFFLCIVLGFLKRSARIGVRHAAFVLVWVVLFCSAAYFVENDYVIWTPLVLYLLHSALLVVLIVVEIAKRIAGSGHTA